MFRNNHITTGPGSGLVRGMQRKDTNTGVHLGWECRADRVNNSREGATPGQLADGVVVGHGVKEPQRRGTSP